MFRIAWAFAMPKGKVSDVFYFLTDDPFEFFATILDLISTAFIVEVV